MPPLRGSGARPSCTPAPKQRSPGEVDQEGCAPHPALPVVTDDGPLPATLPGVHPDLGRADELRTQYDADTFAAELTDERPRTSHHHRRHRPARRRLHAREDAERPRLRAPDQQSAGAHRSA